MQFLVLSMERFKYLTITRFVLLYKSMVQSHLDNCSSVWVLYKKVILN